MQQEIPSYEAVVDTLHWAAQGYVTGHREAIRPMPWRRILDHLSLLERGELLCIDPSANGSENGIAVRPIAPNERPDEEPSSTNASGKTTWTVDARKGLRAKTRFAQRIEMAVRSGEYRSVTCMRRGSRIFATMTAATAPAARSNGACPSPSRVSAGTARKDVYRMTSYLRRTRRNRHAAYTILAASLLLSVAALVSAATGRNENPPTPMPANAIVGHILIDGRGADGVTVALDGRFATATTGGGAFRFRDVETGTHTIAISNYPADARFDRTSATVSIDTERRAATVNFSVRTSTGLASQGRSWWPKEPGSTRHSWICAPPPRAPKSKCRIRQAGHRCASVYRMSRVRGPGVSVRSSRGASPCEVDRGGGLIT